LLTTAINTIKKNAVILISVCILFTSQLSLAQDSSDSPYRVYKNEFSFGLLQGGELAQNGFLAMPRVGYKRFIRNGAIRLITGGTISIPSDSYSNKSEGSISLRVGYQYHVMLGRFMPVLGMDIMSVSQLN